MKFKLKAPCATLTLPDGRTVDVERIGRGRYTTAWRNSHSVYLQTHENDASKELLARLSGISYDNPHLPRCEYLGPQDGASPFRWYKMPLYQPMTAKAGAAWKHLKALKKLQDECWTKTCNETRGAAFRNATADADRMRYNLHDSVDACDIPDTLKEAIKDLVNESFNYGAYSLEFTKKNTAIDEHGTLILLDPLFNLQEIRDKMEAARRRHRGY